MFNTSSDFLEHRTKFGDKKIGLIVLNSCYNNLTIARKILDIHVFGLTLENGNRLDLSNKIIGMFTIAQKHLYYYRPASSIYMRSANKTFSDSTEPKVITHLFYFDNISFLAHALNQSCLPNESSISQASYRTMVLTICFQLFKKQTILWRLDG